MKKLANKRNPIAKALRHPALRPKVVPPKKGRKPYKRVLKGLKMNLDA